MMIGIDKIGTRIIIYICLGFSLSKFCIAGEYAPESDIPEAPPLEQPQGKSLASEAAGDVIESLKALHASLHQLGHSGLKAPSKKEAAGPSAKSGGKGGDIFAQIKTGVKLRETPSGGTSGETEASVATGSKPETVQEELGRRIAGGGGLRKTATMSPSNKPPEETEAQRRHREMVERRAANASK